MKKDPFSQVFYFRRYLRSKKDASMLDFIIHSYNLGLPPMHGFIHPICPNKQASLSSKLVHAYLGLVRLRDSTKLLATQASNIIKVYIDSPDTAHLKLPQHAYIIANTSKYLTTHTAKFGVMSEPLLWDDLISWFVYTIFFDKYDHKAHYYFWVKVFKEYGLNENMRDPVKLGFTSSRK